MMQTSTIVWDAAKRYAVAVSGGVDSMVMLHMLAGMHLPNLFVATVNHGIRPEAQADCSFVAEYCRQLGVPCSVFGVDVPAYAVANKLSTETAARILRYRVLDGLDCDYVCLAHNADDNAETVLMHILRGSGAKGACGMQAASGRYLRPLLEFSRADIEQYAAEHNVPHVEDATNSDTHYTRNFVRHNVMPLLQQINPAAKQNILRFANNIARDDALLTEQASRLLAQVRFDDGGAHIPQPLLDSGNYRLLEMVFGKLGVHCDVEQVHYRDVTALAHNVGGKRVDLPFGLAAYNDYDCVTVCPADQPMQYLFRIPFAVGATQTPLGCAQVSAQPLEGALRADISKLPAGAEFRTRRQGDMFTKFGGGTKPLNRYLIDKKVPARVRDSLVLIACGSEVFAILGVEISEKLRVEGRTPHFIALT